MKFQKLLEPGQIGQAKLRNRIVMPAMVTKYGTEEGYVSQRTKDYYEERAKGGVGLIIIEVTCVDLRGKMIENGLCIYDDKFIPGLRELASVIQRHGARTALQLAHSGREAKSRLTGLQPVAPSPIPIPGGDFPKELTTGEIEEIVARHAEAAKRAKEAGFDGIEICGAHRHLIPQFLSSASNKRGDNYGGKLENRARLLTEIIRAIREVVGGDYPVWCRLNTREYGIDEGITLEETKEVVLMAQRDGTDAIHVSTYGIGSYSWVTTPHIPGFLIETAAEIKKAVELPVIVPGRISPELGERALQQKKADFITMGRALIADPELPNKIASGRLEDIRPCISCLICNDRAVFLPGPVRCSVNAAVGRERESQITPAEKKRRVLVTGSGPGGMEAARVAALRGHEVILYEKEQKLGGQLLLASIPPYKDTIKPLLHYLTSQVSRLGVKVELGKEVTPIIVEKNKPDLVILATGVKSFIPEIPGVHRENVVTAVDVLAGIAQTGERVVIIGGEMVGCETGDFLATKGKKVTITKRGPRMATKMGPVVRRQLLDRLREKGVVLLTEVKYDEITDRGLVITAKDAKRQLIEADTIILAAGGRSNTDLAESLKGRAFKIYPVGDCVEPRGIMGAISEGYRAALAI